MDKLSEYYKILWNLRYDGAPFNTHSSLLQPVIYDGLPCMLKIAIADEERRGNLLMNWWQGNSVPKVLKYDDHAILMERSMGKDSLAEMAKTAGMMRQAQLFAV